MRINKIRTNNVDKILVNAESFEKIDKFFSENDHISKSEIENLVTMFDKVLIVFEIENFEQHNRIMQIISNRNLMNRSLLLERGDRKFEPKSGRYDSQEEIFEYIEDSYDMELIQIAVQILMYIYLVQKNSEVKYVQFENSPISIEERNIELVNMVKKGKRVVRKVKVNTVKTIRIDLEHERNVKRKYTRHTDSWTSRGHWRHYKSGKVSWIPASVKGDKTKEVASKNYTV